MVNRVLGAPLLAAAALTVAPLSAQSDSWPQFRGPGGRSIAPPTSVPVPFDLTKHLAWKVETPPGHSSPIVHGDRVFLSGYEGDELLMLAFSRKTGEELWRRAVRAQAKEVKGHKAVCPAMPTPCTDGEHVWFYFGAYGLVCCDVEGNVVWKKELRMPKTDFGTGNSPILAGDVLVLIRDGARERAVLGLDKKTGEVRWKIPRLMFFYSYTTPFLWKNKEREELVIAGTRRVDSYDPATGKRLWYVDNLTLFVCTTPTADEVTLYCAAWTTANTTGVPLIESVFGKGFFDADEMKDTKVMFAKLDKNQDGKIQEDELHDCRAKDCFAFADSNKSGAWEFKEVRPFVEQNRMPGRNLAVAIEAGGNGNISKTHVRWTFRRGLPYVASPLLHDGRLYLAKAGGLITCLDATTGKPHYRTKRLDERGEYYASPVAVGPYVLVCSSSGTLFALRAGGEFDVAGHAEFGEEIHATPAVLPDQILVRTARHLWAIAAAK